MYLFSAQTNGFYNTQVHKPEQIPADAKEVPDALYASLMTQAAGVPVEIVADSSGMPTIKGQAASTQADLISACITAIQAELDRQAKLKGYYNMESACKYAALPVGAPYQAEGAAYLLWCATVWKTAYDYLARVEAGEVPLPTPSEAVSMMPPLVLP